MTTTEHPWSQTFSGRAFPMHNSEPKDVHWPDIVYGLAHINRFCGQAGTYSVAQHSVVVADQLLPEWKLYGLLHDAHEAYIGDITTPVKRSFHDEGLWQLESLTWIVDHAIYGAAGLSHPVPQTIAEAVHVADVRALMTERRDLMKRWPPKSWGAEYENVCPLSERIVSWTPMQSLARFADALMGCGLTVTAFCYVS